MTEKFSWKSGTQFPVDAQVAASTIRDLQRILGKDTVTAKELLDASRDENAPLHNCFEWDDSVAAECYRQSQARKIINSVEITIIKDDKPPVVTRYFLNTQPVLPKTQGEFATIDTTFGNADYRRQVLQNALNELRNFQRKYSAYEELLGISKAIDAFADTLQ